MSNRRSAWAVLFIIVLLVGLAGPGAVRAQSDYALGYLFPSDQGGHLAYLDDLPLSTYSAIPDNSFAEEVVRLINVERRAGGLPPFKVNSALTVSAYDHSALMRDQECFSHQCPGEAASSQRACQAGYGPYGWGACYIGETIAAGFSTPASVVAGWMGSPGHYKIIMDGTLREIGVGYVSGGYYGYYWTADFGSQPDVIPVFINEGDAATTSHEVTLTLTNEEVSGWGGIDFAVEVMISTDPNFAGAQWEPYSQHKKWTLPSGNGSVTIYIKFRDASGYEVVSTVTIILDAPVEYELELSTNSLVFIYQIGTGFGRSPVGRVEVLNSSGGSSMTWSASGGSPWVGFVPGSGSTPGELQVSVEAFETDTPGESQAFVTVVSPQAPESSEQIVVTVRAVDQVYRMVMPYVVKNE